MRRLRSRSKRWRRRAVHGCRAGRGEVPRGHWLGLRAGAAAGGANRDRVQQGPTDAAEAAAARAAGVTIGCSWPTSVVRRAAPPAMCRPAASTVPRRSAPRRLRLTRRAAPQPHLSVAHRAAVGEPRASHDLHAGRPVRYLPPGLSPADYLVAAAALHAAHRRHADSPARAGAHPPFRGRRLGRRDAAAPRRPPLRARQAFRDGYAPFAPFTGQLQGAPAWGRAAGGGSRRAQPSGLWGGDSYNKSEVALRARERRAGRALLQLSLHWIETRRVAQGAPPLAAFWRSTSARARRRRCSSAQGAQFGVGGTWCAAGPSASTARYSTSCRTATPSPLTTSSSCGLRSSGTTSVPLMIGGLEPAESARRALAVVP